MGNDTVQKIVREGYSEVATSEGSCGCCGSKNRSASLVENIGYTAEELANLPEGANLGLSCGNPSAVAALKRGEVVVDLGSGAGFDAFICAEKVGEKGKVIGVDMTPAMLDKARENSKAFLQRTGLNNVEFRLGEIEYLPIADASVDVIISNCVINLSPDKQQVWREIARVLRPGGRVAVSDIMLTKELPAALQESITAMVGCMAGAIPVDLTLQFADEAGLVNIQHSVKDGYVESMEEWKDPLYKEAIAALPENERVSDYIASMIITAEKPE
jgi:arsenite methyltransferase